MIRRLVGGVGTSIVDKVVIAAMQLAVVPVLAQHWGVATYGMWVVLATVPTFLAFGDFGFATAAGTTMTMQIALGQKEEAARTFAIARAAIGVIAVAVIAAGIGIVWLLPDTLFHPQPDFTTFQMRVAVSLLLSYGVICLQNGTSTAAFRACGRLPIGTLFHAATYFSENMVLILMVVRGASPVGAAATLLVMRTVGVTIQRVTLLRMIPWINSPLAFDWQRTRELLVPARAVMVLPLGTALLLQGTAIALSLSASAMVVPIFTTARTLSRVGLQMTNLFSTALMPEFSAASARQDGATQAKIMAISIASTAAMVIPFAGALALFGPQIIAIWTHGVIHTPRMLAWVMAGSILLSGFWYSLSTLLLALNWQGLYAYAFLVVAAISVPLSYLFSLRLGAIGAGLAMLCADIAMAVIIARLIGQLPISRQAVRDATAAALSPTTWRNLRARRLA